MQTLTDDEFRAGARTLVAAASAGNGMRSGAAASGYLAIVTSIDDADYAREKLAEVARGDALPHLDGEVLETFLAMMRAIVRIHDVEAHLGGRPSRERSSGRGAREYFSGTP